MASRPIAPGLFTTAAPLQLFGARERATHRLVFPPVEDANAFEPVVLPAAGELWSYTVQRFAPKSPPYRGAEPFVPYAIGYVQLAGALIVQSRLTDVAFDELRIGLRMELTTFPLRTEADGSIVLVYAFRPNRGQADG